MPSAKADLQLAADAHRAPPWCVANFAGMEKQAMRTLKLFTVGLAALTTLLVCSAAWSGGGHRGHHRHHHHHGHGSTLSLGFAFGGPLWYPGPVFPSYTYPYPYSYPYAYSPPIIVPPAPRVYIEREDRVAQESSPGYWYYCRESDTYYPYVKECAQPWERVLAQPRNP
jgi:hypothetical protein